MINIVYRYYQIREGFDGVFYISRNGTHIGSASTLEAAKREVDALEPQREDRGYFT